MHNLIICEKPSVAKTISAVLNATERGDGFFYNDEYIVSWCVGHLLELAAPDVYNEKYAKWRYADLPIIPDNWQHIPSKGKAARLKVLHYLMRRADVDCVINACDSGREGENIFRAMYNYAECDKPVKRLWISSMENVAIREGFANLKNGAEYDNLAAAAVCRERADWLVGYNCTRLLTVLYGGVTLSVGRVQSPTLAMLVRREADISSFVKEVYYMPVIRANDIAASGDRISDISAAEAIRATCDGQNAVCLSTEKQWKTTAPPKLFDLTALQREANRLLGFTAQQTLNYVQSLYEKGICTYPRVDSRYITEDMRDTVSAVVAMLQDNLPSTDGDAFVPDIDRLIDNKRVSDHHAILPTAETFKTDLAALPSGECDILNLIAVRLLCAVAPVHSYETVTATLDCGGYTFTAKGKTVIEDGWKAIDQEYKESLKTKPDDEDAADADTALPELIEGQAISGVTATIKECVTTPPRRYTEDTLLSAMENAGADEMPENAERRGIGTPATRAAIIEKIIKAGFVERKKKALIPTEKGTRLIAVLPTMLTSPALTAKWEHMLKSVERGEMTSAAFMEGIAAFTSAIVLENKAPKPEYIGLFGTKKNAGAALGTCPRCGAPIRESARGFFCDNGACGFKLWKDSRFWTAKKKPLTAAIVAVLLKDGCAPIKGLYSEKTGKLYDATVVLDDPGDGFVGYKLKFKK